MKKTLPDQEIANDLATSSVFFPRKEVSKQVSPSKASKERDISTKSNARPVISKVRPRNHATTVASHHEPTPSRKQDIKTPSNQSATITNHQATKLSSNQADELPDMLEEVRKVVKQLGKEAATHRFTGAEKRTLTDLVYTYHRQGYRTSENEITRIAVNWLLLDYQERGAQSILARILEQLHG